jgi:hypothetical protein
MKIDMVNVKLSSLYICDSQMLQLSFDNVENDTYSHIYNKTYLPDIYAKSAG